MAFGPIPQLHWSPHSHMHPFSFSLFLFVRLPFALCLLLHLASSSYVYIETLWIRYVQETRFGGCLFLNYISCCVAMILISYLHLCCCCVWPYHLDTTDVLPPRKNSILSVLCFSIFCTRPLEILLCSCELSQACSYIDV